MKRLFFILIFGMLGSLLFANSSLAETGTNVNVSYDSFTDSYSGSGSNRNLDLYVGYSPTSLDNGDDLVAYNRITNNDDTGPQNLWYRVAFDPDIYEHGQTTIENISGCSNVDTIEIEQDSYSNDDDYNATVRYNNVPSGERACSNVNLAWDYGSNTNTLRNLGLDNAINGKLFAAGEYGAQWDDQMFYSDDGVVINSSSTYREGEMGGTNITLAEMDANEDVKATPVDGDTPVKLIDGENEKVVLETTYENFTNKQSKLIEQHLTD